MIFSNELIDVIQTLFCLGNNRIPAIFTIGNNLNILSQHIIIQHLPQIWAVETLPKNNAINKTKSLHNIFFYNGRCRSS